MKIHLLLLVFLTLLLVAPLNVNAKDCYKTHALKEASGCKHAQCSLQMLGFLSPRVLVLEVVRVIGSSSKFHSICHSVLNYDSPMHGPKIKIHLLLLVSLTLLLVAPLSVNAKDCYKTHALKDRDDGCEDGYYETDSVATVHARTYTCCPHPVSEPTVEQACFQKLVSLTPGDESVCPSDHYLTWVVYPLFQCCQDIVSS
uniref:SVWC domain-containing protein n=1 Tax=Steinernema glaseri TaxID=37863 RepID=A0A1I7ZK92_9BILA